jgi:glycine oxidase
MSDSHDRALNIGIAGAGLAGRLLAWQWLRGGHQVTLFDRDSGEGDQAAGHVAAAMLAPVSEMLACGSEILDPGLRSPAQWRSWIEQLEQDTGQTVPMQQQGSLVVAHSQDRAELNWFYRKLETSALEAGQYRRVRGQELHQLEAGLSSFEEGLFFPSEGCLDNRVLFKVLAQAIRQHSKANWLTGQEVASVEAGLIETTDSAHSFSEQVFDLAVDCRGFGGKPQLDQFRGVRGEVIRVHAPDVAFTRPVRLMHPRYQLYVAPRADHCYVIGATELESESEAEVSVRSSLELMSALYSLHSGFGEATVLEASARCRPTFSDNRPRLIAEDGLLRVNGLYRHGFLMAPALINSALNWVESGAEPEPPVRLVKTSETSPMSTQQSNEEVMP